MQPPAGGACLIIPVSLPLVVSFHYYPSATAALAIAGIYAFVTVAAIVQSLRYPKARYMWTVAVMGLAEATGYALRGMVASSATPSVPLYVNSQLFLLLAPIALACVNYIVVGRLTRATGRRVGCLQPHHIARMFLATDLMVRWRVMASRVLWDGGPLLSRVHATRRTLLFHVHRT